MRKAEDIEEKAGMDPITPGHVLLSRELLGDMFEAVGDKAGASEANSRARSELPLSALVCD